MSLLGFNVAASTVAKYRLKTRQPPSPTCKTFLANHVGEIAGIDFFTVPTATFRNLYGFLVLLHDRRPIVDFNVTAHPTASWTAQQVVAAFPANTSARFLLRARDASYGEEFRRRVQGRQSQEVIPAPQSPWQNAYVERLIGSLRRACLDHLIVLSEAHLRRVLKEYMRYYNFTRPHQSREKNAPLPRVVETARRGPVIFLPEVGGLPQRYQRAA